LTVNRTDYIQLILINKSIVTTNFRWWTNFCYFV